MSEIYRLRCRRLTLRQFGVGSVGGAAFATRSCDIADEQDKQDIRDQANRIFQHGLYEDSALTERSNYFLIAESMLVVAYTGLISSASSAAQPVSTILVAHILAFFGFLLTIIWVYVNRRQWYVIQDLRERALEIVPEYKVTYETRRKRRISSIWSMVYLVPALIGVMWAVFIFIP